MKARDKDLILDCARSRRAVNIHDPLRLARWWRTAGAEARGQVTVRIAEVCSHNGEPDCSRDVAVDHGVTVECVDADTLECLGGSAHT